MPSRSVRERTVLILRLGRRERAIQKSKTARNESGEDLEEKEVQHKLRSLQGETTKLRAARDANARGGKAEGKRACERFLSEDKKPRGSSRVATVFVDEQDRIAGRASRSLDDDAKNFANSGESANSGTSANSRDAALNNSVLSERGDCRAKSLAES